MLEVIDSPLMPQLGYVHCSASNIWLLGFPTTPSVLEASAQTDAKTAGHVSLDAQQAR
jgi:hypothetical protein